MYVDDSLYQCPFPFISSPPTPDHPDPPSSVGLVGVSYSSVTLEWIPGFNGGLAQSYRIRSSPIRNTNKQRQHNNDDDRHRGGLVTLTRPLIDRYRGPHSDSFTYVDVFPLSTAVYTVTNLAPSTTYNFSIAALNAIGESGYEDAASLVATTDGQRRLSGQRCSWNDVYIFI